MTSGRGTSAFHLRSVEADATTGHIELRYGFAGGPEFVERIDLPASPTALNTAEFQSAAAVLLMVAGTSYYKSQAPETIVVEVATTAADRRLIEALYDHGLREFAYTNNLDIPLGQTFDWRGGELTAASQPPDPVGIGRPLVPFGGGKDSTVVLSMLPEARAMTVNQTSTHSSVARSLGHDLIGVRRSVDQVEELTRPDRLNGHIPITAIVSAIAVVLGIRDGLTSVVLANEEAASEPTLVVDGRAVNHQWSKGATFEALFDHALGSRGLPIRYFSWLRHVPERQIIELLARQPDALEHIVSCNRAFAGRTTGATSEADQRWCGECPKCLFTYLLLATRLSPDELVPIFGADLLAKNDRFEGFTELWAEVKPLECVGERTDAAGALVQVAADPRWSDRELVQKLLPSAQDALLAGRWGRMGTDEHILTPRPVPDAFTQRLTETLG